MKSTRFFIAVSFLMGIGGAIASKANNKFLDVRYKESTSSTCLFPTSLPAGCGASGATICTTSNGSFTKTYYQEASCVVAYFRN